MGRRNGSPWSQREASARTVRRAAEKRLKADVGRLIAGSRDDAAWFEQHPERRFHLREPTPSERDQGMRDWLLIMRVAGGRIRLPGFDPEAAAASKYTAEDDTEETCEKLYSSIVADPNRRAAVEWMTRCEALIETAGP